MGAYRFERQPEVVGGRNFLEFDSSADRAIARAFGYEEGSVTLSETSRTPSLIVFDVSARRHRGEGGEEKPLERIGILKCLPKEEIWRRQAHGSRFERRFQ